MQTMLMCVLSQFLKNSIAASLKLADGLQGHLVVKKNKIRREAEMSTMMARFTHLLQLIMISSGLMRLFSMPIFG